MEEVAETSCKNKEVSLPFERTLEEGVRTRKEKGGQTYGNDLL